VPDRIATVDPGRAAAATDCRAVIARGHPPSSPIAAGEAAVAAWRLGRELGLGSAATNQNLTAETAQRFDLVPLAASVAAQASRLGVAAPRLPVYQHAANTLFEFTQFVAIDPDCTAGEIERWYSPRNAAAYRLAQVVGFSTFYRLAMPSLPPLFVPEIRSYGRAAGVPDELLAPWLGRPGGDLDRAAARRIIDSGFSRIDAFLREPVEASAK
jgi:hypothetical protein